MKSTALVEYLNDYLSINTVADYGPQGLQVEARHGEIRRLALAVDTSLPAINAAAEWQADMLLVHHGILWRNVERIAGPLGQRVRKLLASNIHLYAAHLALDAHPEVGNNAVLARMFGVEVEKWWCEPTNVPIGVMGAVSAGTSLEKVVRLVETKLRSTPRTLDHGPHQIKQMAIVSGFGADRIGEAQALGADTFLTGETSHANFWAAADHGMNVIFAGHYATETVGVQALGDHLAQRFDLETRFFDFPTAM